MYKDKRTRVNENIRVPEVRLIDEDGNQIGIVSSKQALEISNEKGLDLVEISPDGKPPVCKIMDFGKYKYQLEISEKLKKKKQSHVVVKEIKLRPKIDKNDLNTKKRQIEKFLNHGNKVKVTIIFKGREIVHKQLAMNILEGLLEDLKDVAVVELMPKLDGYNMIMVIAPV
ncbi:MAG: translation initiation factor IF-3 [Actinobacteria bacterium]|nr:translation initiation factor IF-3 [Actinomycetota bacterium]